MIQSLAREIESPVRRRALDNQARIIPFPKLPARETSAIPQQYEKRARSDAAKLRFRPEFRQVLATRLHYDPAVTSIRNIHNLLLSPSLQSKLECAWERKYGTHYTPQTSLVPVEVQHNAKSKQRRASSIGMQKTTRLQRTPPSFELEVASALNTQTFAETVRNEDIDAIFYLPFSNNQQERATELVFQQQLARYVESYLMGRSSVLRYESDGHSLEASIAVQLSANGDLLPFFVYSCDDCTCFLSHDFDDFIHHIAAN